MRTFMKKLLAIIMVIVVCTSLVYCGEETGTGTESVAPAQPPAVVQPAPPAVPDAVREEAGKDGAAEDVADAGQAAEQEKTAAKQFYTDLDDMVRKRINAYYKSGGKGIAGVYIKELGTGFDYGYNAVKVNESNPKEGYFNTASTCKLFAAATVYYLSNQGELELDKVYKDKVTGWKYNLKNIIYRMVTHSVNDYFNITLRQLGSSKINEVIAQLGTKNSVVYSEIMPAAHTSQKTNLKRYGICRSPRTTPSDLGHILELLYEGNTFGKENDILFAESLKHNIYSNRLPQGIGYKSPVGHKTGTSAGEGVYNDAGIIYLKGNPYIMVVMSKGSPSSVQNMYHRLAKDVYDYMVKRIKKDKS